MPVRSYDYVTCPGCQRRVAVYVPEGGDGAARQFVRHGLKPVPHGRVTACPYSNTQIVRDTVTGAGWKPRE